MISAATASEIASGSVSCMALISAAERYAACRSVGRDPETLERTVALHLRFPGALGRKMAESVAVPPIEGDPETIAAALRAYAALRIGHVQLVLDPITEESIARLGPVLEALDRG